MNPKFVVLDNEILNDHKYDEEFGYNLVFTNILLSFGLIEHTDNIKFKIIDYDKFSLLLLEYPEIIKELLYE